MKLITISGLDGSGKSTQIAMLRQELERNGSKVFYFHAIEFSLANRIIEFRNKYCLICKIIGKCKVRKEKSVTEATGLQIFLRKIFLRIDLWRFDLLRNKLRNKNYDYILSDRYFYDSVVNIEYLESHRGLINQTSMKTILAPDLAIYLQTAPEKIMSHERVPDQDMSYLEKKKALYDTHATEWNMKIIAGDREKNIIFEEIKNYVHAR